MAEQFNADLVYQPQFLKDSVANFITENPEIANQLDRDKFMHYLESLQSAESMFHITAYSEKSWLIHYYKDKQQTSGATLSAYMGHKGYDFKVVFHIPIYAEYDIDNLKVECDAIREALREVVDENENNKGGTK